MATFKIKDLLVSLGPNWQEPPGPTPPPDAARAATAAAPVHCAASMSPHWPHPCFLNSVIGPGCPDHSMILTVCGHNSGEGTTPCWASAPHWGLTGGGPDDLLRLKASLRTAMSAIDKRQEELHAQALAGADAPKTTEEIQALQDRLNEAIKALEKMKTRT